VVANRVEHIGASLSLQDELLRRRRSVEHLWLIRRVSCESPQLLTRRVAQRVVPPCGIEPVASLLLRNAHHIGPALEERRDATDVSATPVAYLGPRG
jgi:hypothetical protein